MIVNPKSNDDVLKEIFSFAENTQAHVRIDILKDIDITIDELTKVADTFIELTTECELKAKAFRNLEGKVTSESPAIDPSGEISDMMEESADGARRIITVYLRKRASIDLDSELYDHHKEDLHAVYENLLQSIAAFEESLSTLCDLLIGYELARESGDNQPIFTNSAALSKHILQ